ncbi:hypothetical protein CFOL_v3_30062 [Cephalotus follicularis]|uniref:Uncharacterized protein n=1 Tax=Cephalotus follicularis TaxID=3775 RepID=A0A1Q3D2G0_CEPFO|nr:hypothetical protein CFOL_v3_30062 [Cephalotus follicularis]
MPQSSSQNTPTLLQTSPPSVCINASNSLPQLPISNPQLACSSASPNAYMHPNDSLQTNFQTVLLPRPHPTSSYPSLSHTAAISVCRNQLSALTSGDEMCDDTLARLMDPIGLPNAPLTLSVSCPPGVCQNGFQILTPSLGTNSSAQDMASNQNDPIAVIEPTLALPPMPHITLDLPNQSGAVIQRPLIYSVASSMIPI